MRVLHIGKYQPSAFGGVERFLDELSRRQARAGLDVACLVHEDKRLGSGLGGETGHAHQAGETPRLFLVPSLGEVSHAPISIRYRGVLRKILREWRPDVLHVHMPNPSVFWLLTSRAARRVPWVIHWHSDVDTRGAGWALRILYFFYKPFEKAMLRQARQVIATSPDYLRASPALAGFRDKSVAIPLGIDAERYAGGEEFSADAQALWRGARLRLLAIGRLTFYKGFQDLIEAVSRVADTRLLIVGEGAQRHALQELIVKRGAEDKVSLLGAREQGFLNALLASCDAVCMPSRSRAEAFGIVLLEAMVFSKPVVASDIHGAGVQLAVEQEHNGFRVGIGDIDAWAACLTRLRDDPDLRERLGATGRRRFEEKFQIAAVEPKIAELYRSPMLVQGKRR